jgi:hypothetical protein
MFVSELSLGPRGWIQIVNFIVFGVLFLLFTRGVAAEFKEGKGSKAGPILLTIIGVSLLVSGPFVMDPASTPRSEWSWHGTLHQLFGGFVFSLSPLSCFVFLRRFWQDPKWQRLRWWTLTVGIVTLTAVVVMRVGPTLPAGPPNTFNAWIGFIQRMILIPYLAWIFTFAVALHRRTKSRREQVEEFATKPAS